MIRMMKAPRNNISTIVNIIIIAYVIIMFAIAGLPLFGKVNGAQNMTCNEIEQRAFDMLVTQYHSRRARHIVPYVLDMYTDMYRYQGCGDVLDVRRGYG